MKKLTLKFLAEGIQRVEDLVKAAYKMILDDRDRLKALEEWKNDPWTPRTSACATELPSPMIFPPLKPLKLPCTTCKHYRASNKSIWGNGKPSEYDKCLIAKIPHCVDGPKSEWCDRSNADQLCKFHSERKS